MTNKSSEDAESDVVIRPFADFLREVNKGSVHDELSKALHDLIAKVREVRKPGKVTLVLKVDWMKSTGMLQITDDVKVELPKFDRKASLWFVDRNGNVTRNDPNQLTFSTMQSVPDVSGLIVVDHQPADKPNTKEA